MDFKDWITLISPVVYFFMTLWLIFGHRKNGTNDKFPCIVVRTRKNAFTEDSKRKDESKEDSSIDNNKKAPSEEEKSQRQWGIRLLNIGRGPAFIQHFVTEGLTRGKPPDDWFRYSDGIHTQDIDKVIGPEVGDPNLQVHFAYGDSEFLRSDKVSIGIIYNDIAGRQFKSGIIKRNPVWDPPPEFFHLKLSLWLRKLLQCISRNKRVPAIVSRWLKKLLVKFYKELEAPSDEVKALRDFLDKYIAEESS
jgi:hypothetical protein